MLLSHTGGRSLPPGRPVRKPGCSGHTDIKPGRSESDVQNAPYITCRLHLLRFLSIFSPAAFQSWTQRSASALVSGPPRLRYNGNRPEPDNAPSEYRELLFFFFLRHILHSAIPNYAFIAHGAVSLFHIRKEHMAAVHLKADLIIF